MSKRIETSGDDALFRTFMRQPGDEAALHELQTLAMSMSEPELRRFCEGIMAALVVVQDQWRKRFPEEWAAFDAEIES